jgi:cytochrome d ubiquinol oxidase subunit I
LDSVDLSRLQFAVTALYHFLFVPLSIGLSMLLGIMESVYVMTGREIWRKITKFWGVLFGINLAMGVATGVTMEFQFGTNWAYFSHYTGDIFGAPLALEGIIAFFLESSFAGLFFFGWNRLSKLGHLTATWLLALGANLSALWILIANAWMQNPTGARFNVQTMRMETANFADIILNPVAQAKFVHTVSAAYVTGAGFVMAISAYYLLRRRHQDIARRSMAVAASFGLASILSVIVLGDQSGYELTDHQQMKIAAIEAMWHTEPAPASFTVVGFPDIASQTTRAAIRVPWLLGLIATRSFDEQVAGIDDLVARAERRIRSGLIGQRAIQLWRAGDSSQIVTIAAHSRDLGYALLLRHFREDIENATDADINAAARLTIPDVPSLFWSFRAMVGISVLLLALYLSAFYFAARGTLGNHRLFLWFSLLALPLPWVAIELGWVIAEYGRQPWAIEGLLPTRLAASALSTGQVGLSLAGFVLFYSALLVTDLYLMVRLIRKGPQPETEHAY